MQEIGTLSIRNASNNQGCSSGCTWQRSVENCIFNGILLWTSRSKIQPSTSQHSQEDHRQVQVTDSLIIGLMGLRWCKAESHIWTQGYKNNDNIAPLRKGRTQIPCSERLTEIVSAPHDSLIWSIIRLLALKFTLWKLICCSNKALRQGTSEPTCHKRIMICVVLSFLLVSYPSDLTTGHTFHSTAHLSISKCFIDVHYK